LLSETEAVDSVQAIPGVQEVNLVFGQWDAVDIAELKSGF